MKQRIVVAVFNTGLSGILAQMILLRELLIVFSGNEFSIGIILANWLVMEALGSLFVGRHAERVKRVLPAYAGLTVLFSLSLPGMVYLTRILRPLLGLSIGQEVGIVPIVIASCLILLPVSAPHGALFSFGCTLYSRFSESKAASLGKGYVFETLGTIVGGVVWTFVLATRLHSFQASVGLGAVNGLLSFLLLGGLSGTEAPSRAWAAVCLLLSIAGLGALFAGVGDRFHQGSIRTQWAPQNLVHYQNSRYGNVSVIEAEGQYTFFLNSQPHLVTPIPDIPVVEERVHIPMISHPDPRNLLVLSGGAGGVIHEILEHPSVSSVEYVELDPLLLDLLRRFPTSLTEKELGDPRVNVVHRDGRLHLKETERLYDIIWIGLGEPSDLQTNRFHTREFFSLAGRKLTRWGILVFAIPGSLAYSSEELKNLNSCLFHTAREVFPYIRVIPGDGGNLFLCSSMPGIDQMDRTTMALRSAERGLRGQVTVPRHIEQKLHPGWTQWFESLTEGSSRQINRDLRPIGVFYHTAHWNTIFTPALRSFFRLVQRLRWWMIALLSTGAAAALMPIEARRGWSFRAAAPLFIGTTGFAGMVLSLVLVYMFQAVYGYVFAWIGLLVTAFMTGSAMGGMIVTAVLPRLKRPFAAFCAVDLLIIGFTGLLAFLILGLQPWLEISRLGLSLGAAVLGLSLASGLLISAQFPLAGQLYLRRQDSLGRAAGSLYACDLMGGWAGGMLGGALLLPVMGMGIACLAVASLKIPILLLCVLARRGWHE